MQHHVSSTTSGTVLIAPTVMSTDDMVDAALAGLGQGEVVTIPSLADRADRDRCDAAHRAMFGRLSSAVPAPLYDVGQTR